MTAAAIGFRLGDALSAQQRASLTAGSCERSLKVNELKACIAFRGGIPKGTKKADFVSQLAKMLGNVVVPMLLCDKM